MLDKWRDREWRANAVTYLVMGAIAVFVLVGLYLQETERWDMDEQRAPDRIPVKYETEWGR